jgi:hypothetical protein
MYNKLLIKFNFFFIFIIDVLLFLIKNLLDLQILFSKRRRKNISTKMEFIKEKLNWVFEKIKYFLSPNILFSYSTTKLVKIQDWRVGLIFRTVQFFVFIYIIGKRDNLNLGFVLIFQQVLLFINFL